jgi:hypothetical protein
MCLTAVSSAEGARCGWRLAVLRIKRNATDAGLNLNAAPRPESLECATAETAVGGAEKQRSAGRHKGRRRRGEEKDGHDSQGTIKLTHALGPGMANIAVRPWARTSETQGKPVQSASHVPQLPLSFSPVPVSPVHGQLRLAQVR